jgi:proteasome lid subunit RPN8/RPN11
VYDKIILSEKQKQQIETHTLAEYPREMCGFLTKEDFIPCKNVADLSEDPFSDGFKISPVDTAQYLPEAIAIVHSHCRPTKKRTYFDLRTPSQVDIQNQKPTKLPWLIVGCEGISVSGPVQFPRIPNNNYLGREFLWSINDCYTLIQDWYFFELGKVLKDHPIQKDHTCMPEYTETVEDLISEDGFYKVSYEEGYLPGDLILLDNPGVERSHLAVYTGHSVIHQLDLSVEVPFETFIGRIRQVYRYGK